MNPARAATSGSGLAHTLTAIALVAVAGLLLAACGSSNSPSSSSSSPTPTPSPSPKLVTSVDACTLVTTTDASTAAGTAVTNLGAASGAQVSGACLYGSSDGKTSVVVFAQTYPDATTAQAVSPEQIAAAINVGGAGAASAKPVSGIGDKAVEYSSTTAGSNGTVIFVFKANVVMMIAITPAPSSNAIEQLARTAAGRI
jgi:Protein of unknown function (DUF3558)